MAHTLFKYYSQSYRWFHNYVRHVSLLSRFHQFNARKCRELLICFTRHLTRWEPQKEIWNPRVALLRTSYKLIDTFFLQSFMKWVCNKWSNCISLKMMDAAAIPVWIIKQNNWICYNLLLSLQVNRLFWSLALTRVLIHSVLHGSSDIRGPRMLNDHHIILPLHFSTVYPRSSLDNSPKNLDDTSKG